MKIRQIRLFRQPAFVHNTQFTIYLSPVSDWHRPLLCGFKRRQIQRFQQSSIAWEHASLTVQLSVSGIQTLNGVGRIYDLSDHCGTFENRGDGIPVLFPAPHGIGIFFTPFFRDPFQGGQRFFFRCRLLDCFKIRTEGLPVFV